MSTEILRRDLRDRRTGSVVLGASLAVLAFFALGMSVPMGDLIDSITASLTPAMQAFLGKDTPGGYVVGEVFTLIAPIAVVAYAVMGGASILAGEEQSKTMGLLSAQPVTRTRILWSKSVALLLGLLAAVAIFWLGMSVGSVVFDAGLSPGQAAAGCLHLLFLGLAFGGSRSASPPPRAGRSSRPGSWAASPSSPTSLRRCSRSPATRPPRSSAPGTTTSAATR
ncbi:hypothetical protein GCM10025865_11120 [Paraoerskovia sediminicola]|uniref:ABC-2 type transport system permease protein n=1 Tax=Paraoerskovia sediminicola TaxID=1138587 RepID=A0ABN6XEC1_9CELL|nr:ABC transporter permease subunit [Paraoerskovia sediminicola]BDZ41813.1 hypothetical protein GCM10025865_11120 [Paraoerskovia sediminicola]